MPLAAHIPRARLSLPICVLISVVLAAGTEYDAIVIGSGMGGLTTAARMVAKGAKVLVLEKVTGHATCRSRIFKYQSWSGAVLGPIYCRSEQN